MNNFPAGTEDNIGTGSALVPAPVGAPRDRDLTLDERQQTVRARRLARAAGRRRGQGYLGDKRADPVVVAQLKAAWDIRKVLVTANQERHKLTARRSERRRATEETRANLKALEKNTAAARSARQADQRLAATRPGWTSSARS